MIRKIRDFYARYLQKRRVCQHCGGKENSSHGRVMFGKAFDPVKPKRYYHEICYSIAFNQSTPNFKRGSES